MNHPNLIGLFALLLLIRGTVPFFLRGIDQ